MSRTKFRVISFSLLVMLLLISTLSLSAQESRTLVVCATGCDASTLQQALNIASSGDRIEIRAGLYANTSVVINKSVTVMGDDEEVILRGSPDQAVLDVAGFGISVTLSRLTISGGNVGMGVSGNPEVLLEESVIRDNDFEGIFVSGEAQVTLRNNAIIENNLTTPETFGRGIGINEQAQVTLEDNIIDGNGEEGVGIFGEATVILRNNQILNTVLTESGFGRGLTIIDSVEAIVEDNLIEGNAEAGVLIFGAPTISLTGNEIRRNQDGIWIAADPAVITLDQNIILQNESCGVFVASGEPGPQVSGSGNTVQIDDPFCDESRRLPWN